MISLRVPGSKSITNRALIVAALAKGTSHLSNVLESDDTKHMQRALKMLGVQFHKNLLVKGGTVRASKKTLYCGNAGTATRFLTAVLATQPFESIIDGDKRMRERPIEDLLKALRQLGATAESVKKTGCPPVRVKGPMKGGACTVSGTISSQFLSGLLLAAPLAQNSVTITIKGELVSKPYVDMTIEVMKSFGVEVKRSGYEKFFIKKGQHYKAQKYSVEGDASSAGYFWGISALTKEPIEVTNVPKASNQADAYLSTLLRTKNVFNKEGNLSINCSDFPDSAMTLAVLMAFRKGFTHLYGLSNLRVKESDRLKALKQELTKIGCKVKETPDGLKIWGDPERLYGATIETYNDHRMAMCFGMASFVIPEIKIKNPQCVSKTYPNFWKNFSELKKVFLKKNIILTGMRGSGKSELGKKLAKKLKRRFIDVDKIIEQKSGMKIAQIVKKYGWKHFRKLEQQAVASIKSLQHAVISTGGGTLIYPKNVKILKKTGKIIFLKSSLKTLKKRLSKDKNRPSLTGTNPLAELEKVYKEREPKYHAVADAVMDVSHNSSDKRGDFTIKARQLEKIVANFGLI